MAEDTGSAHNQYMDVLLRIGFFGFCIYIIILWRISRVLIIRHGYIFCGFSGVLIYGMFHETFKEPSGALLLAFLLSYYSMVIRKSRVLGGVIHSKCGVDS